MTLTIDGRQATVGGSLLEAILALGIPLPHLCKDDHLPAIGACRTCLVDADGRIVAACSVGAASASIVSTTSERAVRLRRGVLELTAAMQAVPDAIGGGPHSHELREAARTERADPGRHLSRTGRDVVDTSNPFFSFHEDACILCGRCTTACQQLQHISAIGLAGQAVGSRVTPGAAVSFRDSVCTSCGSCVAACPTTALRPNVGGT